MEVIQTVFDQLRSDIQQRLTVLEKQIVFMLAQANQKQPPSDDFLKIKEAMDALNNRLGRMEYRIQNLEVKQASPHPTPGLPSAGLEGLLLKPLTLPSPILSSEQNTIIQPTVQRAVVLHEEPDVAEPDEEALEGELAAEAGGLEEVVEEVIEEGEEEVEEEAEEEEADEVQLEEWLWKGKMYYKSPDNKVYRTNSDGDVEDDPFAEYIPNPPPGRLVRI